MVTRTAPTYQHRSHGAMFPLSPLRALVVAGVCGAIGAAVDTAVGSYEVRTIFAVGFSIGAALAMLLVERRDMIRTLVWIPLVYVLLLLIGAAISGRSTAVSWFVLAFVFKAPVVLIATATAIVVAGLRAMLHR
jgi:hypothetical protein